MRIVSRMAFGAALLLLASCGKSDTAPGDAKTPADNPAPGGTTAPTTTSKDPGTPPPAPAYELDPTKHAYTGPLAGRINGQPLAIDIQVERGGLHARSLNKDGTSSTAFELFLTDPAKSVEGVNLTVKPEQPEGLDVPTVIVFNPNDASLQPKNLVKGYALTLSIGKREKGKVSGKIQLCIADEKQSYLAGSFTADWLRAPNESPGAEDAPFIHGKLTVTGATDPYAWLGYIRTDTDKTSIDVVGTDLKPGTPAARSDGNRPRMGLLAPGEGGSKNPARFEFTRLEPGRYWVFATIKGGPVVGKWITVEPGSQLAFDLSINAALFGSLDVTAAGSTEFVSVVPADESGKPWPESLVPTAASIAEMQSQNVKADAAKPLSVRFPRLSPGKYEVWAGELHSTVEIKPNETAKVELMKK